MSKVSTLNSKARRSQKGTSIIEFAVTLPVIIFAVTIALNLGITLLAVRTVDLAARDAARAASLQQTPDKALQAARAAVTAHNYPGQTFTIDQNDFVFDTAPTNGQPYYGPGPHVSLTVKASAELPFKLNLLSADARTGRLPVSRSYTFPIMKLPSRVRPIEAKKPFPQPAA